MSSNGRLTEALRERGRGQGRRVMAKRNGMSRLEASRLSSSACDKRTRLSRVQVEESETL